MEQELEDQGDIFALQEELNQLVKTIQDQIDEGMSKLDEIEKTEKTISEIKEEKDEPEREG